MPTNTFLMFCCLLNKLSQAFRRFDVALIRSAPPFVDVFMIDVFEDFDEKHATN